MEFFKKRSTAWAVLIAVIAVSFFIGQARKPASQTQILPAGEYVQDNANVLSASTEKHMTQMNNDLVSRVGGEIHVVTVDTTGGEDIFDKAIDLANDTNLSASSCIFFIAVDDVDAVIVQGDELLYAFSDDELSYILQSNFTEDDFRNRTIDTPARRAFDALIGMYEDYYGVSISGSEHVVVNNSADYDESTMVAVYVLIIVLIILIVYVASRPRRYRQRTVVVPGGTTVHRTGHYPPRGSYTTPPPYRPGTNRSSRTGGFSSGNRGGSFSSSSSRTGGFGSSSRGGSFSSGSSSRGGSFSSSRSSFGGSSRSGGFGGGSRGGSFGGGSRGGGFRK
ncbi:MAG: TPM domain-containing protein [Oscillospiraceae bacterium]|nr:TPM domain-containing protein [Oscillospiraceae bacterium]